VSFAPRGTDRGEDRAGEALAVVAARVGAVRLIDNTLLPVVA
jgi:pantothenate synthetase